MKREDLTREQGAVVDHAEEAFVEACPGSGKTGTIVTRVVERARALPPRRGIAVLSFTNSAVEEFEQRLNKMGEIHLGRLPHFLGTVDSFIRTYLFNPGGAPGCALRPTVIDSWRTLDREVRLNGRAAFPGPAVGLDRFDADTGAVDPALIGHAGLRAHVTANRGAYEARARQMRQGLHRRGVFSAADARVVAQRRIRDPNWSQPLQAALSARFAELIIDEAQDSNPADLEMIAWLRQAGIPVTIVCDVDQSIYGFRMGAPAVLQDYKATYPERSWLPLTGNFRSSPAVCGIAATLRSRHEPDRSVGDAREVAHRVMVLSFAGQPSPAIGVAFADQARGRGVAIEKSIVLAHGRRAAMLAANTPGQEGGGDSSVAILARAVGTFHNPASTGRDREMALARTERLLLALQGIIEAGELVQHALERHGRDRRTSKRLALDLLAAMPSVCPADVAGRAAWVDSARAVVTAFDLSLPQGATINRLLSTRANADWHIHLSPPAPQMLAAATVHEVKGREYDAVCLVVPPDPPGSNRLTPLLDSWEFRTDLEAKRVIYVGATRARQFLMLAIPAAYKPRIAAVMAAAGQVFDEIEL